LVMVDSVAQSLLQNFLSDSFATYLGYMLISLGQLLLTNHDHQLQVVALVQWSGLLSSSQNELHRRKSSNDHSWKNIREFLAILVFLNRGMDLLK